MIYSSYTNSCLTQTLNTTMTKRHNIKIKDLPEQERLFWLKLARTKRISPTLFFRLVDIFNSPKNVLENIEEFSKKSGCNNPIKPIDDYLIEQELEKCQKSNGVILAFCENSYPKLLREISDPPPILTAIGNTDLLNKKVVSVIGTRNSSFNGYKFAQDISNQLGRNNFIVSSGMARGIDTAAHLGALKNGTIAVLAGGVDHIYPKSNTNLYKQICEQGVIISELECGFVPRGGNFPQRNRIISGISMGTAVIEATVKSGTLITARFALEHNREVFAVPGPPYDTRHQGTNRLIKDGAIMLLSHNDILQEFGNSKSDLLNFAENDEGVIEQEKLIPGDSILRDAEDLLLNKINFVPITIEEIIQQCEEVSIQAINVVLTQLELTDKIENKNGKISLKSG